MRWPFKRRLSGARAGSQRQSHSANVRRELRDSGGAQAESEGYYFDFGSYDGYPVEYIGPARFPDCRRDGCMNTIPHRPGEGCIG